MKMIAFILIISWLFVATFFWYDIEKQKLFYLNFIPDKYELVSMKVGASTVGLYRINKNTGETTYYIPGEDEGGWVKVSESGMVTVSRKEGNINKGLLNQIESYINIGIAKGGRDGFGIYLLKEDGEKDYIDEFDTETLKILVDIYEKKSNDPQEISQNFNDEYLVNIELSNAKFTVGKGVLLNLTVQNKGDKTINMLVVKMVYLDNNGNPAVIKNINHTQIIPLPNILIYSKGVGQYKVPLSKEQYPYYKEVKNYKLELLHCKVI